MIPSIQFRTAATSPKPLGFPTSQDVLAQEATPVTNARPELSSQTKGPPESPLQAEARPSAQKLDSSISGEYAPHSPFLLVEISAS